MVKISKNMSMTQHESASTACLSLKQQNSEALGNSNFFELIVAYTLKLNLVNTSIEFWIKIA